MPEKKFKIPTAEGEKSILIDNTALFRFEEIHNQPAIQVLLSGGMGARAINHFVWAGLQHEDESIHIDDVLKMVRLKDHKQIGNTIMKALEAAFEMEEKS